MRIKPICHLIFHNLFTAGIYFLVGLAGLQLAIPPGYASAVFPAAGVAAAVVLYSGNRLLPGIWLGSVGINSWMALSHGGTTIGFFPVTAFIALGAVFQAWLSAFLVRYYLKESWRVLDRDTTIIRFLLIAGPLACLMSASIGNSVLVLSGEISAEEFAFSWWNWWVGDTIGVLLFAPLTLTVLLRNESLWHTRLTYAALPTIGAIVAITSVFIYVSGSELLKFKQRIDEKGLALANHLQLKLQSYEDITASLGNFIGVSPSLSYGDFDNFTQQNFSVHPDLVSLSWNRLINNADRTAFERAMAEESGRARFRIFQRNAQNRPVSAQIRETYLVARYVAPPDRQRSELGYDLSSDPVLRSAIDTAVGSGKTVVSEPFNLNDQSRDVKAVAVFSPVYSGRPDYAGSGSTLVRKPHGLAAGLFDVDRMVAGYLATNRVDTLAYILVDKAAPESEKLLYRSGPDIQSEFVGFAWQADILFAGRTWRLSVYPTKAYFVDERSLLAWVIQATGLLLVSLLQAFLLAMTGLAAVIRCQVNEQTKELSRKEKFLRLSQESGGIGTWEADLINDRQIWSETCTDLLGFPGFSEPKWADFLAVVHPEDRQRVIDATNAHIEHGVKYDVEYRAIDVGGNVRWMRSAGQVERNADDRPVIMRGVVQDINELKQATEALRISEARSRALIEASPVPYALNDDAQNIIYLNDAFIRTFGYTLDDIATLDEWWPKAYPDPEYRVWVAETWQLKLDRARQNNGEFEPVELTIRCKDGSIKTAMVGAALLDGAFSGTHLIILYDITERKLMQKRLAEQLIFTEAVIEAEVDALAVCHRISEPPFVRFTVWNPSMERLTGYNMDEINRLGWYQTVYIDPEVQEKAKQRMDRMRHGDHLCNEEWTITQKNGENRVVRIHTVTVAEDERGVHVLAVMHDMTERMKAEQDMRIAATVFESQQGMLVSDADNTVLRVNRAFTEITGYSSEEIIGQNPRILQSGRQDTAFYSDMWDCIKNTGAWEGELWNRRKNGEIFPEHLTVTAVKDSNGKVTNYVATLSDITLSKAAADEIELLAFYDPLTGLPNRRLLLDRLKPALASSHRSGRCGALLFIDMDNFKTLNDTLGHDYGDMLLKQVSERLTESIREVDTVARLGGDEFVVMLEGLSEQREEATEQTDIVGKKILSVLNRPYQLASHYYHSTPSIGATIFVGQTQATDELLKQADIAMYQAKLSGRNALRFFDPEMQAKINERATLEADLRNALAEKQFQLYYQLQVCHNSRKVGAEALIRWNHPERGLLMPNEFIPLAEETGLILPIGQWVLEMACEQIKRWEADERTESLQLAVNVSARQFRQIDFVGQVLSVLRRTAIKPKKLKLELTESMVLDDIDDTIVKMHALREMGVRISMDDFGTGHSSLSSLKRLPIDQIKIDQSFVRDISDDPDDAVIVQTIISMTKELGMEVIAEGVETEAQRLFLEQHDCQICQGFLFGRPMPIEQFQSFLAKPEIAATE